MKTIEIYKQYPVHRGLQEHMIRVAAVAKQILTNYQSTIDADTIITACLLHDMGNLIKVKFEVEPELFEPEGVAHWQEEQLKLRDTYGEDVHAATIAMIQSSGINGRVLEVVNEASFDNIVHVAESGSIEAQMLLYADMRVGLNGIVSLESRFQDIRNRYVPHRFSSEEVDSRLQAALSIENYIFSNTSISPTDITDESTVEIQKNLWHWEVNEDT